MEITAPTVEKAQKTAVTLLKKLWNYEIRRTDALKAFARANVELRSFFKNKKGDTDWAGRSQDFRNAQEEVYKAAGVPSASSSPLQASIRYHVGNILREELTAEELATVGLSKESPIEKARIAREAAKAAKDKAAAEGKANGEGGEVKLTLYGVLNINDKPAARVTQDGHDGMRNSIRFDMTPLIDLEPIHLKNVTTVGLALDSLRVAEASLTDDPILALMLQRTIMDVGDMVTKILRLNTEALAAAKAALRADTRPEQTVVDISNNVPATQAASA